MSASVVPALGSWYTSPGVALSRSVRRARRAGPAAAVAVRSMTTTPAMPSGPVPASRAAPSASTTCSGSEPGAVRALPGVNRGRSCSSSMGSRAPSEGAISRTGPAASCSVGCMLCGSHLIHSQWWNRSADAHTLMRRSAGECITAAWATSDRTRARTAPGSPVGTILVTDLSETSTGSPGTWPWARMKRRSAPAHSGSRSSTGLVSGGTSRIDRACVPVANRTQPKPASAGNRCQIRSLPAATSDGSDRGAGPLYSMARRCSPAARRTLRRIWPR